MNKYHVDNRDIYYMIGCNTTATTSWPTFFGPSKVKIYTGEISLNAKAWNGRVICAWLAETMPLAARGYPAEYDEGRLTLVCYSLNLDPICGWPYHPHTCKPEFVFGGPSNCPARAAVGWSRPSSHCPGKCMARFFWLCESNPRRLTLDWKLVVSKHFGHPEPMFVFDQEIRV